MMNNIYKKFSTAESIAITLAKNVAAILEKSIFTNKTATLLLSGGNTPKLFLNKLSLCDIEWEKVVVGLVDERMVETSNKDSNEYMIRKEFCNNNALKVNIVGMYEDEDLDTIEDLCSAKYKEIFSKIDVLVLGMGTDGHTASLFPFNQKLEEAFDLQNTNFCIAILPTDAPYKRLSLTLASILRAENIFLHIEGSQKIAVYNDVLKSEESIRYPILKVLNSNNIIKVYAHE